MPACQPIDLSELLNDSLSNRSIGERSRIVRDVSTLFVNQAENYSAAHIELFDAVLMRLISKIDEQVRIYVAERLSRVDNAPRRVVRHLADDDDVKIAGPLLSRSNCLDEEFLIASAKTKSQEHLIAISSRPIIGERVTDVLVDRGNDQVVLTLAQNGGAEFSERGCSLVIERAKDNHQLARVMWNRNDIPRQQVLKLIAKASESVQQELKAEGARPAQELADALEFSSQKLQEKSQESSSAYARAKARVHALQQSGGLSESHVLLFARNGEFEEVVTVISEMSRLSAADIERMILDDAPNRLLIVSKAIGMSWTTLRQVMLLMTRTTPKEAAQMERLSATYRSIPREAAVKTLQFHQLREKARGRSL